ncbi:MAG: serine/threonine protein kinase [Prevotella sp.]|nr:serine/threonine protein kinase [Prevotella sp.]
MSNITTGTIVKDRYILKEFKGRGTFGEVWLAHDNMLNSDIAIKIYISLDPRGLEEFKSEYITTEGLSHPNLLTTNYFDVWEQHPFLVMKYCPDGPSSQLAGKTDEYTIWKFIHDVSAGLKKLHSLAEPIVHQDIKPDNILMDQGNFLITDFGISKKVRSTMRRQSKRAVGAGATAYMGPERFDSDPTPVKASDIWSLGASIYELATGELPFSGLGGGMQKNGAEMPSLDRKWSKDLNMVMQSCLAKETWNRPTAQQLEDFSDAIIKGVPAKATWNLRPEQFSALNPEIEANVDENTYDEEIQWDEDKPDQIDIDYYSDLGRLSKMILWGGILTFAVSFLYLILSNTHQLSGSQKLLYMIEPSLFLGLAVYAHHAILKRKPNAMFLSQGFLTICLISWIISFLTISFNILGVIVIIWCVVALYQSFKGEDALTVFPYSFRKIGLKDILIVAGTFLIPIAIGLIARKVGEKPEGPISSYPPDNDTTIVAPQKETVDTRIPLVEPKKKELIIETKSEVEGKKEKQKQPTNDNKADDAPTSKQETQKFEAPVIHKDELVKEESQVNKLVLSPQALKNALSKGDYQTVQKMANQGYAPAYGPLAQYYLQNNEFSAAENYAKKAKAAGFSDGQRVLDALKNLGYYD